MKNLIDLLPEHLKEGITPAEVRLLAAVQKGDEVDFRSGDEEIDKPENADKWGNERIIRSEILYWLCTNPDAIQNIHTRGIQFLGAKITGIIDFNYAVIPHPLLIYDCYIEEIYFRYAKTKTIDLSGSFIILFDADGVFIEGNLFLRDVTVKGIVRMINANISRGLSCSSVLSHK